MRSRSGTAWFRIGLALLLAAVPLGGLIPIRPVAAAAPPSFVRGAYGKDSSYNPSTTNDQNLKTGFAVMAATGFNAYQANPEAIEIDYQYQTYGLWGVVWVGDYDNDNCVWTMTDSELDYQVNKVRGHTGVLAYYIADEPLLSRCPNAPSQLRQRTARIHSLDPNAKTFTVIQDYESPSLLPAPCNAAADQGRPYRCWAGTGAVDIFGFDVYPCHFTSVPTAQNLASDGSYALPSIGYVTSPTHLCDWSKIDTDKAAIESLGFSPYWAVVQSFQDCYYHALSPNELATQFQHWQGGRLTGYWYFSWNFKSSVSSFCQSLGVRLEDAPGVVTELRTENDSGQSPCGSATATVTGISPSFGPSTGDTNVSITGCGFTGATRVNFGSTAASSFTLVSGSQITAVSPAHPAGTADVTVTTPNGTSSTSAADRFTFLALSVYTGRNPLRILDTRIDGGRLTPGGDHILAIGGVSVPQNATSVILNVTVTNTSSAGVLTIYPTGQSLPLASNLNWAANKTLPNLVSVSLGAGGDITIHNYTGYVDVIVDLEGYFAPSANGTVGEFVPLPPSRISDTRSGSGQPNASSRLGPGSTLDVQVTGAGGVPLSGVAAVILNVTVTNTTGWGYLTVYPTGTSRPLASNLNWTPGKTVPNRVVVPTGSGGKVSLYNSAGSTDVVVDVNGYVTDSTAGGARFLPLGPARILDTRNGTGGFSRPIGANSAIAVAVAGQGGVPAMTASMPPQAVVLNVTVTDTSALSFLTVWPDGLSRPLASDLNWTAGVTVPNLVVVKLGPDGKIDLYNSSGSTDVVIDVVGWFG